MTTTYTGRELALVTGLPATNAASRLGPLLGHRPPGSGRLGPHRPGYRFSLEDLVVVAVVHRYGLDPRQWNPLLRDFVLRVTDSRSRYLILYSHRGNGWATATDLDDLLRYLDDDPFVIVFDLHRVRGDVLEAIAGSSSSC